MKLSVIIVNYNVRFFLEQCLDSVLRAMSGVEGEIIVVDNNSVDGSVEMVKSKYPTVKLVANTVNSGFSKANNQAIHLSSGSYVLLLNPDTVVEEDTFSKCVNFMDQHPEAGALGVRMIDGKGVFLPESKRGLPTPEVALYKMFGLNKIFSQNKKFGKYHLGFLPEHEVAEIEVLSGAFMFIRKEALLKTGLLDEDFFMYGEDIDLSYRILQAGYKNFYFPETTIIHYKGESTKKQSVNYVFVFYRAMILFAQKHYSSGKSGMLILFIQMAIYLRASLAVFQRLMRRSWVMMADVIWIVGGMFLLKSYWEDHIKHITRYPDELMTIHVPYYTLLWVMSVYLSGGYSKPYSFGRVFRGIMAGTILILAVYGLFPNELRFSRALIILGSIIALSGMMLFRLLHHFLKTGKVSLDDEGEPATIIIGNATERKRVREILERSSFAPSIIGYVASDNQHKETGDLGTLQQLDEIAKIYKVQQIIFCGTDISSKEIIKWMNAIGQMDMVYKIVPRDANFIIGSNSKDSSGELFSEEVELNLGQAHTKRKKRIFDLTASMIILFLSPLLIWIQKSPKKFVRDIASVLSGSKTWIGYATENDASLPPIKPGILNTACDLSIHEVSTEILKKIDYLYAKNYRIEKDLQLLLSHFKSL